jgi:hypothetical protein
MIAYVQLVATHSDTVHALTAHFDCDFDHCKKPVRCVSCVFVHTSRDGACTHSHHVSLASPHRHWPSTHTGSRRCSTSIRRLPCARKTRSACTSSAHQTQRYYGIRARARVCVCMCVCQLLRIWCESCTQQNPRDLDITIDYTPPIGKPWSQDYRLR